MKNKELKALGKVINYLWYDEAEDFLSLDEEERENHIFESLQILNRYYLKH